MFPTLRSMRSMARDIGQAKLPAPEMIGAGQAAVEMCGHARAAAYFAAAAFCFAVTPSR